MSKKSFLKGAIILGIAGLIVKILGAFFRIPLANVIGDEGMGYYQTAYPVYVFLLVLSTSGIPTAISKIVSEKNAVGNRQGAHRVFRISFILLFFIGITTSVALYLGAGYLVHVLKNPGAYDAMIAIAPALLFVPVMAAYRGYFQGLQDMKPTAVSQVIEQLFRVVTGLFLAYFLVTKGLKYAAAGASFGAAAGAIAGSITIIGIYYIKRNSIHKNIKASKRTDTESIGKILYKIFVIAIPITIGAAIMPIMNMIDVAIVMRRLQEVGFTREAAVSLYGQLTGMAGPLINFPQILSMSIAWSLVPAISDANERKDYDFLRYNVKTGVRVSIIIGLPCAFGLMALSQQIMLLMFPMQKASALSAAPSLFILAFGVIFLSTVQTLTGVLQGLGKPVIPVINLAVGSIFKIVCTFVLTGIPNINVKGAAVGTAVAYAVASLLNLMAVKKYTNTHFDFNLSVIKPLVSSAVMAGAVVGSYDLLDLYMGRSISTVIAVMVGVFVYAIMLFVIKGITYDDLKMMPKGDKIIKLLKKIKLMPN